MNRSPEGNTVIVSGPQGCGKSLRAAELAARYGCRKIVEEWSPGMRTVHGALHLTHTQMVDAPAGVQLVRWSEVDSAASTEQVKEVANVA